MIPVSLLTCITRSHLVKLGMAGQGYAEQKEKQRGLHTQNRETSTGDQARYFW
jgi:hypothetical protein